MRGITTSLASFVLFSCAFAGPNLVANPVVAEHNVPSSARTAIVNTSAPQPSNTAEVQLPQPQPSALGGSGASSYYSPAWVPHGQNIGQQGPNLNQYGGGSPLGTLNASQLPSFIPGGPLPQGFPWAGRTCHNTNAYTDPPNTGVTRRYTFNVAPATIAPDGVERPGFLINGQFPAPTIEANWGDWIEVTVTNNLDEATTLHWHGLLQKQSPWMDGVPSVSQCPSTLR